MQAAHEAGRLPILTGGTGMYFAALTDGLADIPDPGRRRARRGPPAAGRIGPAALHARLAQGRSRHRRAAEARGQPAHRPRLGGLARHRAPAWRPGRSRRSDPGAVALHRDPARSAARRTARRHRRPVRRHAGGRRAGGGAGAAGAGPRPGAAGDARPWRAGTVGLSARDAVAGRGEPAGGTASPGNTPSARRHGSGITRLHTQTRTYTIHARFYVFDAIFGKFSAGIVHIYSRSGVDRTGLHQPMRPRPHSGNGGRQLCRRTSTQSGAEILLRALKDQGVEVIFGYPGGAVLPIYDALFQQNAIRHILVRQEQAARSMPPRAMRAPPARSAWCW